MFKERLNELMKENNTTKAELIRAIGITDGAINGWLTKNSQPTADKIIKIANYYQISSDYLLGRENDVGLVEIKNGLSTDENKLIDNFRALPTAQQLTLLQVSDTFRMSAETEKIKKKLW